LQALALGLTDKEIAQQLQISNETQRTHIVNLLGKLGVHSRLEALVFALRHGVVTIS
jgi:DNA-binding NarL/FixJ family response regulator